MFFERINLDEISPIKLIKIFKENKQINENIIKDLFRRFKDILFCEPNVLCFHSPITVIGGIYGHIYDLFRIFALSDDDFENLLSWPTKLKNTYLFLGNYVDHGNHSFETITFLSILKIKYPHQIYLLRGNHEFRNVNMSWLYKDCLNIYGHCGIWDDINDAFALLPIAAVIDHKIFCVHGGLTPKINYIGQISTINRRKCKFDSAYSDLLYSSPVDNFKSFYINPKGPGYYFGKNQTVSFLYNNGLIKRNEKVLDEANKNPRHGFVLCSILSEDEGFKWYHDHYLLTVVSAPNYTNREYNKSKAAFVKIKENEGPDIVVLEEDERSQMKRYDDYIDYYIS